MHVLYVNVCFIQTHAGYVAPPYYPASQPPPPPGAWAPQPVSVEFVSAITILYLCMYTVESLRTLINLYRYSAASVLYMHGYECMHTANKQFNCGALKTIFAA